MEAKERENVENKINLICNHCKIEVSNLTIIFQIDGIYILEICTYEKDIVLTPILKFLNQYYEYEKLFCYNCQRKYNHKNEKLAYYFCKTCNILFCKQCILIHNKLNKNHIFISNDIENTMKCQIHFEKVTKIDLKKKINLCEKCFNIMENKEDIINNSDFLKRNEIENKMNNLIEQYNNFEKLNLKNYDIMKNEMKDTENNENYLKVLKDSLDYNHEVNGNIIKFLQIIKNQILNNHNLEYNLLYNFKENSELNDYIYSFSSSKDIFENYSSFNKYLRNYFIIKTKLFYPQMIKSTLSYRNQFSKHKDDIYYIIQLTDKRIVLASQKHTIQFYDNLKYNLIYTINVNKSGVYCLNELQNKKLISGSKNGEIKIWNVIKYYQLILTIKVYEKAVWRIMNLNNDKIIVLSENPIIKIFNITTFENINIDSGEDKLNSLLVLKDNRFLIGGRNGNIKIFNFNNNKILKNLNQHSQEINYIYELHDGRIVTASSDKTIKIWDSFSGQILSTLYGHKTIIKVLLQDKSSLLISVSLDGDIKLWDIFNYQCFFSFFSYYHFLTFTNLIICPIENGFIINHFSEVSLFKRNEDKNSFQIIELDCNND